MTDRFHEDSDRCQTEYSTRQAQGANYASTGRSRPDSKDIKVQAILSWDTYTDLDIEVEGPDGKIYYSNPVGDGHFLLLDENVQPKTTKAVEDHFFLQKCRKGAFKVFVNNYTHRDGMIPCSFLVHFRLYRDGTPEAPVSFYPPEGSGLFHKDRVMVGTVIIGETDADTELRIEPPKMPTEGSGWMKMAQVITKQADGYPGVAVYREKTDRNPFGELANDVVITVHSMDHTWYGFEGTFGEQFGTYYLKKRNAHSTSMGRTECNYSGGGDGGHYHERGGCRC